MSQTPRFAKSAAIAVMLALVLTALTGISMAQEDPVTITWAFWGSPEERATHEAVAAAYTALNPHVTIEIWSEPWNDYFTKIQTLWASGDASIIPDVAFLTPVSVYAPSGALENLEPYIEASQYDTSDYWPFLLESAIYDGDIYGLPRDISVEVLYYNRDIFDEVGLDYPDDTWTWDDLRAAAEALTIIAPSGRVVRYGLAMEGGKYQLWVGQNYGSILDDFRNPTACTLSQPEAVEAITFFADLLNNNYAMRDANLSQAGGDAAVFQSGQAAMIIQNASRISAFNAAGLNYDVAPVPIPEGGQRAAASGGAAWTMSSFSQHKDEAWNFIRWLQSTEGGQAIYTASGEIFPALSSTARSDVFLGLDAPPSNRQAFLTEAENAKVGRFGYFRQWNELNGSIINPNLQRIWSGEAAPSVVLPELCASVDAFLAENGFVQ
jgi:multiple sugar transport system substrate-binding protein